MNNREMITLSLDRDAVDNYCRELARHLSRLDRRVVALDAVQTFLAALTDPAQQAKTEYAAIRESLGGHFEEARSALQAEQSAALTDALERRSLARILPIYNALSREAFWQLMGQAAEVLGPEVSSELARWSGEWLAAVEERSAELSPYPDAIDFKALGIEVADYAAMSDIRKCFAQR